MEKQKKKKKKKTLISCKRHKGLEKMFISLQAEQNFPPAGQISLQCGMVSIMYFVIFPLQITKFPGKGLPILPVFLDLATQ